MGDCAARGADLFESIAAEIISAMILGGTMAQRCKIEGKYCVCIFIVMCVFVGMYMSIGSLIIYLFMQIHLASSCFLLLFTLLTLWFHQLEFFQ